MLGNFSVFLLATALYFYLLPSLEPSLLMLIVKCLPVFSLAGAVYLEGNKKLQSGYEKFIACGFLSSGVGDAFLVWHKLFPLGMVAFGVAHCFYIKAFGFKPLKPLIGLFLFAITGIVLLRIIPNIRDETVAYGAPVYSLLLATMSWRALARVTNGPDAWSWPKTICAIGSVLFVVSDAIICFHDLQNPIPYGRVLIMSTYYAAQLGIAISVKSSSYGN